MEETAEVIREYETRALVRVIRHSSCSKCDRDCHLAGQEPETEVMELEVDNPIGARQGNLVKLEMGEKPLVIASVIVYLLPLLFLIGGYFAGDYLLGRFIHVSGENLNVLSSFVFLAISFALIRVLDGYFEQKQSFQPRIIEVIQSRASI